MSENLDSIYSRSFSRAAEFWPSTDFIFKLMPVWAFSAACEIGDFIIVQVIALLAHPISHQHKGLSLINIAAATALGIACYFTFYQGQLYDIRSLRNSLRALGNLTLRWSFLCLLILASVIVLRNAGAPQYYHFFLFFIVGLAGFTVERIVIGYAIRYWISRGNYVHSVAIIDDGRSAGYLRDKLDQTSSGTRISGIFYDGQNRGAAASAPGSIQALVDLITRDEVDTVILAVRGMSARRLNGLIHTLRQHPIDIYATPEAVSLPPITCKWPVKYGFPGLSLIPLANCPINKAALLVKNTIDRLTACAIFLLVFPVMLVCAAGIALSDPGPVFFEQKRIGYKGREFSILKFRTMYVSVRPHTKLTAKNDPRIFPFGKLLRKTSLDELPQLINVLKGDMSLVGPRPHMPQATAAGVLYFDAVGDYTARHRVKPGITGWAQVNGWRGPTETIDQIKSRVAHDLYYIENWSLVLDFMILFKTAFVLFGKNVF